MKLNLSPSTIVFWGLLAAFFAVTQIMFGNYFGPRETIVSIILFTLLYSWKHWLGVAHLGLSFLCALIYGLVGLTYGHVDKNAIDALLYTNFDEAFEYASSIPPGVFFWYSTLVLLFVSIFFFLKKSPDFLRTLKLKTAIPLLLILVVLATSTYVKNLSRGLPSRTWQLKCTEVTFPLAVHSAFLASSNGRNKYSIFNRSSDWQAVSSQNAPTNFVIILGESARRDFFGAYGAPWDNTPWLSNEPGLLFRHFISAAPGTAPSLSRALYIRSEEDNFNPAYNLITLARSAGFKTVWISAQGERGGADSPISVAAKMSDQYEFIDDDLNPLNKVIKKNDDDLLEPFKESLSIVGKKLIVLHLYGSHPKACRRTDDKYTEFFRTKELSCYIESIRNTDRLAREVTDALKAKEAENGEKWSLLFTSDHGLDFFTDQEGWCMKHTDKHQGSYEVPFFITGSQYQQREIIDAYRSGLDFLSLSAAWMEITSPKLPLKSCAWLKDEVCQDQEFVYRFSGERVNFHDLPELSLESFIKENP